MTKEGWIECTLDELVSQQGLFSDGDWVEKKDQEIDGEVRLIQLADIGDGFFRDKSNKRVTHKWAIENNCSFLKTGDILIARMPDPLGRATIFPLEGEEKYITAVDVAILRTSNIYINQNYLLHLINSPSIRNQIDKLKSGTTRKRISRKNLNKIPFQIASPPEQCAIVSKIEELFSDLDKGIADLKKAQDQLKVYRQAVLKKAFEGELTKSWRDSKELNSDWTTYTFAEITESLKRGPFGGDLKKSFFVENGYAVYEQQHAINNDFTTIRYHIDQERYDKLKACNVGPGDYIVSCSGTMGKIARLPKGSPNGVINQALLRIRINESIISHEYFLEYFRSALFQRKILKDSRGSGMQNMAGIKEIKPIRIKVPTLLEQSQIIKEIESRLSICNKVEISITESLEKAEVLRQSILKKAFEGNLLSPQEIEKCKTAPDYEPAAALLAKIKSEKK